MYGTNAQLIINRCMSKPHTEIKSGSGLGTRLGNVVIVLISGMAKRAKPVG